MWRNWLKNTDEEIFKCVNLCVEKTENFLLSRYIKNEDDAAQCVNLLIENFEEIIIYQRHLQYGSLFWPKIDF